MQQGEQNQTDRADRRLATLERKNRLLLKRSEYYQVFNDVFDKPTLMVIEKLINSGKVKSIRSHFGSGKESQVFLAEAHDGSLLALKIYLTVSAEFKKRRRYIAGDRRFSKTKTGSRNLVSVWANKEFRNLKAAYKSGVRVPAPIIVRRNVLLMKFVGDTHGNAATILADSPNVSLEDYNEIIDQVRTLYQRARLVHADLSEYNIFKTQSGEIMLFDFGSAVDVRQPNARQFLVRDIMNVNKFFEKKGVPVLDIALAMEKVCGFEVDNDKIMDAQVHFQSELRD